MALKIFEDLVQGEPAWLQARAGIVTASTVGQLITAKTLKPANNDTARGLIATLAAERITGHVEEVFPTRQMQRGTLDEPFARDIYSKYYAEAVEVGFMVLDLETSKLGYSPDGLVADDGLIEIKSRNQKIHLNTILEDAVPLANMAQIQAGLLVSGREWCDYISYCGGMPLYVQRVEPDTNWHAAITEAVERFETEATQIITQYTLRTGGRPPTERINHFEDLELKL